MEAAILTRAAEVRQPGEYLGFLEWVAWGVLSRRRVFMLFGSHVCDVIEVFAPEVLPIAFEGVCRVAAVVYADGGALLAAGFGAHAGSFANHFVIAVASAESPAEIAAEGFAPAVAHLPSCARRAALRAGWLLRGTVAQGDCGVDAMAYSLRRERTPATWAELREAIAEFLFLHAHQELWQDIAGACQENQA